MIIFKDLRAELPRNSRRVFRKRSVERIVGIVVHHTAGGDDVFATARYHISPNHVSADGCPAINYTFHIDKSGAVSLCNDLDDKTWSIGKPPPFAIEGKQRPSSNQYFLSIVMGGSFHHRRWNKTGEHPTLNQIQALSSLLNALTSSETPPEALPFSGAPTDIAALRGYVWGALSHLTEADLYGHFDFGKAACPADTLENLIKAIRTNGTRYIERRTISSARDWQQRLNDLGFNAGKVDGLWGPRSRAALIAFEQSQGLEPMGHRSDRVRKLLEEA